MFQRILVPLDGSTCAEQALPIAAALAHSAGGSLLLVGVSTPEASEAERRRSGPKRLVVGSVAERLLGTTRHPLLVVHPISRDARSIQELSPQRNISSEGQFL